MTTYLVQNIETFETITTFASEAAFDAWMSESETYGIVSLDSDADGEYDFVALVAPLDGPDYDMNDVPQEEIVAMLTTAAAPAVESINPTPTSHEDETPVPVEAKVPQPRKTRKSKAKGAKMSTQTKRIRNFEILVAFIEANPGVSRTDVFADAGLQTSLRTPAQIKAIAAGDKAEVKRWNRRLNFLIRESGRQGVDIQIERKGRIAHYTIVPASGQLELPFDDAAEARNAAITGADLSVDVQIEAPAVDPKRADEPENVSLNFEDLLAQLDEDAATITHDDQVAFENAKKMLK